MELDKRIKKGKTYLDCFSLEKAKNFIGKECYIGEENSSFANLDNLTKATLVDVTRHSNDTQPYTLSTIRSTYVASLILPCEWVEEPEFRPYTDTEFLTLYDLGRFHSIRVIGEPYSRIVISSIYRSTDDILYIRVNGDKSGYGILWLFKHCEYFDGEEWKPFGIKE